MAGPTVDALVERLRAEGVRLTRPRRTVLDALVAAGSHVTADALLEHIHRDHPEVNPSTVYRTMDLLSGLGIVDHVHLGHGPAEYHLADEAHAHLVCDDCGAVIELPDTLSEPLSRRVADDLDFHLDLGHFALTGRCGRCERGR